MGVLGASGISCCSMSSSGGLLVSLAMTDHDAHIIIIILLLLPHGRKGGKCSFHKHRRLPRSKGAG